VLNYCIVIVLDDTVLIDLIKKGILLVFSDFIALLDTIESSLEVGSFLLSDLAFLNVLCHLSLLSGFLGGKMGSLILGTVFKS